MEFSKLIPVVILLKMRKAGIQNKLSEVPTAILAELIDSLNLESNYNSDEIIKACDELSDESFRPLDEMGLSPLYNLIDKYRFEIGSELVKKADDDIAKDLLNEYNELNVKLNLVKEKLSNVLMEDRYHNIIEANISDANSIADIIIRYFKRQGV